MVLSAKKLVKELLRKKYNLLILSMSRLYLKKNGDVCSFSTLGSDLIHSPIYKIGYILYTLGTCIVDTSYLLSVHSKLALFVRSHLGHARREFSSNVV